MDYLKVRITRDLDRGQLLFMFEVDAMMKCFIIRSLRSDCTDLASETRTINSVSDMRNRRRYTDERDWIGGRDPARRTCAFIVRNKGIRLIV